MATNQTGIAITIKAWLPTGKTLDEQLAALTLVKTAHETGDYAPLLAAAQIEAVQTDSKTRRVEEQTVEQRAVEMANDIEAVAAYNPVLDSVVNPADAPVAAKPKLARSQQGVAVSAARDAAEAAGL